LEFAHFCLKELSLPFGSFDIAFDGKKCTLLEYQAVHFGLTTAEKGRFYYKRAPAGEWTKIAGRIDIEKEIADAITASLKLGRNALPERTGC
jgi:hypothetical protein